MMINHYYFLFVLVFLIININTVISKHVSEIDSNNIHKFLKNKITLLSFYAPWCQHCQLFKPLYENVAEKLKRRNPTITCGSVDVTENQALGECSRNVVYYIVLVLVYCNLTNKTLYTLTIL